MFVFNPEADPAGPWKQVMRQAAALGNQRIAILPADMAIEQSVPVNMTRFLSVMEKPDAAKPMNLHLRPRPLADGGFNRAHRAKPSRAKERGPGEQHRVENLRRTGDPRQPFQPVNDELKNQSPLGSTGARSATDGPFNTFPSASNREPWHGQSHVVSVRFQCTMHFKCGQIAVISWSVPASSR
jgi:hypothetical protein